MNPQTNNLQNLNPSLAASLNLSGGQDQVTPSQDPSLASGGNNSLMDFLLPTAGAVVGGLIPGLGETGLGEAGGAAVGQALSDILQGKTPGGDVATTGATSLILPKVLGPLFSGLAGKLGEAADTLQGIPSSDIFNSVVQKDPWMLQNASQLTSTAKDLGYMDQPMATSLQQMPQDFANIHSQILDSLNGNSTSIPLTKGLADKPSLLDNFNSQIENANYSSGDPQFDSATNNITNRITNLGDGTASPLDIYNEKARMSNLLSNTFDKQARGGTLLPKEEANLAYFNSLKDTLDQYGSPEIRALNTKQNQLYDIAKAFGSQYAKTAGKNAPKFGFGNLLPEGVGAITANAIGANPLLGIGVGLGGQFLSNNPTALNLGANTLKGLANPTVLAGAGAAGGGLLNGILSPSISSINTNTTSTTPVMGSGMTSPNNIQNNNNQQNNAQSNLPTFLGGNTSQTNQVSPSRGSITQSTNGVQRDSKGNFILPDFNSVQTPIPGQIYPPELEQQDLAKVAQLPFYMQDAAIAQINAKAALNSRVVNQFLSTHQLSSDQVDLVKQIPQTNQQMNVLRGLIQTKAGANAFQAMLNDTPIIQQIKSAQDPQYAQMLGLMKTLRSAAEYAQVHGRLSNFDIQQLNNMPGPGDTAKTALGKLDLAQGILANQYTQLLPEYGYTLQAQSQPQQTTPVPGANVMGNPLSLMNILGLGQPTQ